ncbi:MAG: hypothetical protein GX230_03755, partial [Lentisphaerae bacterium]|nr:hypothetical protein [Lentisphaerota bacterium]
SYLVGFADNKLGVYNTAWRGNFAVSRQLNRWYHVAFSFDGTNMTFYLDGALLGSAAFSYTHNATHTAKIGGYHTTSDVNGSVSEVRVWDHARTQAEIQFLMNSRLNGAEPGLLGYWPLAEGKGLQALDETTNGSHGVLVNATWASDDTLSLERLFTVAHPVTGNRRFTDTNVLAVVAFPWLDGYTDYQITLNSAEPLPAAWVATNSRPESVVLALADDNDSTTTITLWMTNVTESVSLLRFDQAIVYTKTFYWRGTVDSDWFNATNWNHEVLPPPGSHVVITGGKQATLNDSTVALGTLVISNATLTFANWDTLLTVGEFHGGEGAVITHAGPIISDAMSNRVNIACANFTLAAGASIAVNSKGYAGTRNGTEGNRGHGPGKSSAERGAAGHGGKGGGANGGQVYGDPSQPLYLGSSGDGQYGATGGHGGGAVRIAASGHVVINGSILASSSDVASNSGGGSGGSIYITAGTIAATNGQLRADGASTTQMGGGGGGRIAINIADHVTQAQLPRVVYGLSARRGDRTTINGEHGTVWLNDRNLMPTIMNNCNGYFLGIDDWDWRVPVMAMTNSWLIIDQDMSLAVDGDMRLFNTTMDTTTLALDINGDLDVCGASSVYVRSGPTNGVAPWGATVNVAGTLSMGAGSTIYTASNPTNGGSVCYTLGNLVMASGSSINADGLGFSGGPVQGYGPGGGTGSYGGGGYGGAGGRPPYGGPA